MPRKKEQVVQIGIGDDASLDVIRLEDGNVLFVISERGSIQRRTVAAIGTADAIRIAKFIVGIVDIKDIDTSESG